MELGGEEVIVSAKSLTFWIHAIPACFERREYTAYFLISLVLVQWMILPIKCLQCQCWVQVTHDH